MFYVLLCIPLSLSSFAIILLGKRELFALLSLFNLLSLSFCCLMVAINLWLFLTEPWVGLQCVIVVFLDHTHLLFWTRIEGLPVQESQESLYSVIEQCILFLSRSSTQAVR